MATETPGKPTARIRRYAIWSVFCWTLLILVNAVFVIRSERESVRQIALAEAHADFNSRMLQYEATSPKMRDFFLQANDSAQVEMPLTQLQVALGEYAFAHEADRHEADAESDHGEFGKIHLFLGKEPGTDPVVAQASAALTAGAREYFVLDEQTPGGRSRLFRPLIVKESCLSCHGDFSSSIGKIAGAAEVSSTLKGLPDNTRRHMATALGGHAILWFVGLCAVLVAYRRLGREIVLRFHAETNARENQVFLQTLVDSMRDYIIVIDREYRIVFSNKSFQEAFPATQSAPAHSHCYDVLMGKSEPCSSCGEAPVDCVLEKLVDSNGHEHVETHDFPVNGREILLHSVVSPLRGANGEVKAVIEVMRDVTSERQTQIELRQSESKFRMLFENCFDGIAYADLETQGIIDANPRFCEISGYSVEELKSKSITELHPIEVRAHAQSRFAAHGRGEAFVEEDIPLQRADGTTIYVDISAVQSTIEDRPILAGFFRDTTARKAVTDSLRSQSLVVEQMHDAVITAMGNGKITAWNFGARRLFGYEFADAIGRNFDTLVDSSNTEGVHVAFANAWLGHAKSPLGVIMVRKSGAKFTALLSLTPVRENGSVVSAVAAYVLDLSELRETHEALRQTEQRLEMVLDGTNMGIWDWDLTTHRATYNERWYVMLGYPTGEFEPSSTVWKELIHPDDFPRAQQSLINHLRQRTPYYESEIRIRHRDGHWVWASNRGHIIQRDEAGRALRICGMTQDITERKRAEQVLLARVRLSEIARTQTIDRLLQEVLDEAERLTESSIGFLHFVSEDENSLHLQQWSSNTLKHMCTAEGKGLHYPVCSAGVWADAVRERKAVVHNDYQALSTRKGYPEGHAHVSREMVVPVLRAGKVVALVGVGNKAGPYDETDLSAIQRLADMAWDVVLAKQAELALSGSEEHYRLLMETAADAIHILDKDGAIVQCNQSFLNLLGYTEDELIGRNISELEAQWTPEIVQSKLHRIHEQPRNFETQLRHKNGVDIVNVEISMSVAEHDDHSMVIYCAARDITERKRAETIRTTLNQILTTFETRDGAALYTDVLAILLEVTRSSFGLFGYLNEAGDWVCPSVTPDAYPGMAVPSAGMVFPKESWTGLWGRALREKTIQVQNDNLSVPDGHVTLNNAVAVPLVHDGNLIGQFALSNKDGGYFDHDLKLLQAIAAQITPVLAARIERDRVLGERELAVIELSRSEQRYRILFDEMFTGFAVHQIVCDAAGVPVDYVFLSVNPAWEHMTGFRAEQVVGKRVLEVFPKTETFWIDRYGKVALSGEPIQFEGESDQFGRVFEVRAYSPEHGLFAVLIIDVTARYKAEEELRSSTERMQLVLQNMPVMLDAFDEQGRIVAWNRECERVTGYVEEEVLDSDAVLEKLYPDPAYRARMLEEFSLRKGGYRNWEWRTTCKDGAQRVIAWSSISSEAPIPGWATWGVGVDVTERVEAQQELVRLAAAIEQAGEGIAMTDSMGFIQYANPAFLAMTGFEREEILNQPALIVNSGEEIEEAFRTIGEIVLSGASWSGRVTNRRRDGVLYVIDTTVSPVHVDGGTIGAYVLVAKDVTHELAMEEQLRHSQKMESIGQLAGGVAHDFNNLLQVINGYTELAMEEIDDRDQAIELLQEVAHAGERAAALVHQLLAFSRKQVLRPEDLDLNEIISGWLKSLGRVLGEQVQLGFIPGHDLWGIRADRGMIEQILMNLCVNGRDAMPGGGKLTLSTENVFLTEPQTTLHDIVAPGRYVRFSVTDTGVGMDTETQSRIFEPFFTTKGPGKGTGLGLSTVYGIVKQHNGSVEVASVPGHGTTFTVLMCATETQTNSATTVTEKRKFQFSGTVLLAEDEQQVRHLSRDMLERLGLRVIEARDGAEAVSLFKQHAEEITFLLFDLVMPQMSGLDAYRLIQTEGRDVPILFVSGYSEVETSTHFLHEHQFTLLQKPFDAQTLAQTLERLMSADDIAW